MSLAVLDLNADRVWAMCGEPGRTPQVVPLDDDHAELPLVVALDEPALPLGHAALGRTRKSPHVICSGFLQRLGDRWQWQFGRHRLDAAQALSLILRQVRKRLPPVHGTVISTPSYLSRDQVNRLTALTREAGIPVLGVLPRIQAAGLTSYAEHPSQQVGVVADIDGHAFSCAVLRVDEGELVCLGKRHSSALNLQLWKERLLTRVAENCVRVSRRDPRQSGDADQMLFEQIDVVLEGCSQGRPVALQVKAPDWFLGLTVQPGEAAAACAPLADQAAREVEAALTWCRQQMNSGSIHFAAGVARLPGLAAAVYQRCDNRVPIVMLPPTAVARACYEIGRRVLKGEIPSSYFSPAAPLPLIDEWTDAPPMIRFPRERRPASRS